MSKFKVGDKVYYPSQGTDIFTLSNSKSGSLCPLTLYDNRLALGSFNTDGRNGLNVLPLIYHATPKNHALLEQLYGVEFEKPPAKPTAHEVIVAMFKQRGAKYVPCWVSNTNENPNHNDFPVFIEGYSNRVGFPYRDTNRTRWTFATPFDPRTSESITELPEQTKQGT